MSEKMIVEQCSPTMAGLKTGSLFSCPMKSKKELADSIRRFNALLVPKGVCIIPVKYMGNRALIYMYRPKKLCEDLSDCVAADILTSKNYPQSTARCVAELVARLNSGDDFPHEVGLFLGYPPEDVYGFINKGAACAKCVGTWKVYGDEQAAKEKFALYKKCKKNYISAYNRHNSFCRLVVKS